MSGMSLQELAGGLLEVAGALMNLNETHSLDLCYIAKISGKVYHITIIYYYRTIEGQGGRLLVRHN